MSKTHSETSWRKLRLGGHERDYLIHIPSSAPVQNRALVLGFHGSASSAAHFVEFSGLTEVGDDEGFISVIPQGLGPDRLRRSWNAGGCCRWAFKENIDDIAFVSTIISSVIDEFGVDPNRIFATGMSNGGMMAYRLALELSDRITAVASVAGPMSLIQATPSRPLSVCHFHGTLDEYTPFLGGVGKRSTSKTNFPSAAASVEAWRRFNGCDEQFVEEALPTIIEDGTQVTRRTWSGGRNGSLVILYTIDGMGHTWPGRKTRLTHLGPMTANICASRTMWEFFNRVTPRK